tara:strand:- start:13101 stop:14231 length:1131 start_codon:yes stop_codon:yes gene_type:complete
MNSAIHAFNQLSTEILFINEDLRVITMNEAASSGGWNAVQNQESDILNKLINKEDIENKNLAALSSILEEESFLRINEIINLANENSSSITQRDFQINFNDGLNKAIDLTISKSNEFSIFILEMTNVDNLNKIIDSTKSFSSQKIAAGLARSLAHEVKNPLSGIKGSAQILNKKYSDDFSKKFLKIIVDETDRLNEIVTRILTPAKKPQLEQFNIHEALERVLNLVDVENLNKVNVNKDYDPSIPELFGDKNLFIQAVLNICQNAIHACVNSNTNPEISIKTGITFRQPINGHIYSTLTLIKISDNGPGIDEEIKDQIFFPMVSAKENGSGLGLSIAQDIVRVHGGSIHYERKEDITSFFIMIPINQNQIKEQAHA